jgi:secreted trypsin-like serine protease
MRFVIVAVILLVTTLELSVRGDDVSPGRVYMGYQINITDAPYMAYVRFKTYNDKGQRVDSLCGGTIISRQYILTAGHCKYQSKY